METEILTGFIIWLLSAIIVGVILAILDIDFDAPKSFLSFIICTYLVSKFLFSINDSLFVDNTPNQPIQTTKKNLELIEAYKCRLDYGAKGVCGTIKNNSSHTYSYAQVGINLYDANGTLVGSTMANINNFKPNKYWHFKTFVIENDAVSFEVEDISGF